MSNSHHSHPADDRRPLILLDVDGVVNDIGSHLGRWRSWASRIVRSHGFVIVIPEFMPALIQYLDLIGEVVWCTTWRTRANDDIAPALGVGPFEAIDDGTHRRDVDWKAGAAFRRADEALAEGRRVIWIEDFAGYVPAAEMPPGVEFVDTAADGEYVFLPEHLPADLRPSSLPGREREGSDSAGR